MLGRNVTSFSDHTVHSLPECTSTCQLIFNAGGSIEREAIQSAYRAGSGVALEER